jgi:hypothetical protein
MSQQNTSNKKLYGIYYEPLHDGKCKPQWSWPTDRQWLKMPKSDSVRMEHEYRTFMDTHYGASSRSIRRPRSLAVVEAREIDSLIQLTDLFTIWLRSEKITRQNEIVNLENGNLSKEDMLSHRNMRIEMSMDCLLYKMESLKLGK